MCIFKGLMFTDTIERLHSHEACQRMNAFQIGRIKERWTNFLPPIQGGHFRPYSGDDADDKSQSYFEVSSEESSCTPSPNFESDDVATFRQRRSTSTMNTSISASPLMAETKSRAYVIDARTEEEILLDQSKYPPLDMQHQDNIIKKYRSLNERIHAAGLYKCNYFAYAIEAVRYSVLFSLFLLFLNWGYFCLAGTFLGCFWHQLVFTAHDAGHMGITHHFQTDTVIGMIAADYLGGLSLGWWKRSHNVHHIVTNAPEHDPDIELMPFFALSHRFFGNLRSTYYDRVMKYDAMARFTVKHQHYMYYPILLLGRFNLYFLSWEHIYLGLGPRYGAGWWHRWFELTGQVFFWTWFGYGICYLSIPDWWSRILFVLISHIITAPLHVQITLSHYAMSTADLGPHECFPQKMLRTTMDVDCPAWLDFFHGGLQFQAIHHLYPRIPRHNLRKTQQFVKEFCEDVHIPYAIFTFYDGNNQVIGRLGDIAKQAKILEECRKAGARQGGLGDHRSH